MSAENFCAVSDVSPHWPCVSKWSVTRGLLRYGLSLAVLSRARRRSTVRHRHRLSEGQLAPAFPIGEVDSCPLSNSHLSRLFLRYKLSRFAWMCRYIVYFTKPRSARCWK